MEQLQSSGILELVHYVTQTSVSTLTETVSSSGNEPSEFQKELEEQTVTVRKETERAAQEAQPKAEQSTRSPETEKESAEQTLEAEQMVVQQLIAAGVVNITRTEEAVIPQEAGTGPTTEAGTAVLTVGPDTATVPTEGNVRPNAPEQAQMPAANGEGSGQPVETAQQGPTAAQGTPTQGEMTPEQGETQWTVRQETVPQSEPREELRITDAEEAQQPLFGEVKEIPVKVGETERAHRPAPTASVEEQVEVKLTDALRQGETKVEIRLDPAQLGTIKVELTRSADGTLHVVLSTENGQTGSLLEKHSANLQNLLLAAGQERVQIEVHTAQESQQDPQQDLADGRGGNPRREQPQHRDEQNTQDFLQQLRLGLIPVEEAS